MNHLVLDTNIIVKDFQMTGNLFSALFPNIGAIAERIVIPKVVLEETINQFRKKVSEEKGKAKKALRNINRMSGMKLCHPELDDIETLTTEYSTYLEEKIKSEAIYIAEYPGVSHEIMAQKAIHRKKPFKNSGEGYCDSLIWETIKEILTQNPNDSIIFLTNNSRDFCSSGTLHSQLAEELEELGVNTSRLELFPSLKELSDKKLFSHLRYLDSLKNQINNDDVPDVEIEEWLEERLWGAFDENDLRFLFGDLGKNECDVEITEIYSASSINVEEARVVSDTKKYISFTANIGVGFHVCAYYTEFRESEVLQGIFAKYDGNEPLPYDCAYVAEEIEFDLSVIVENDDFENSTLEIISMSYNGRSVDFTTK